MDIYKKTKSPCIGVCSTGIGDSVCRGCKRFMHEVIDWNSYKEGERRAIVRRMSSLAAQVAAPVIEIYDVELLERTLAFQNVRFDETAGPYLWLMELLQIGANSIGNLEAYGCRLAPEYKGVSLSVLKEQIDSDFFTLSEVHYQRYFKKD